jgi:hypothetical protein
VTYEPAGGSVVSNLVVLVALAVVLFVAGAVAIPRTD